jgi:bifunctional non-homologous end joining protein LigD
MLATSGPVPPEDGRWVCEVKWDGWRALVTIDGAVTIHTRRGRNATSSFPELACLADALNGRRVVLDGELVAARNDRIDFWAIGGRWHASESRRSPVAFLAFDVLWVDGERVTHEPLRERKAILADLNLDGLAWREAPWQVGDRRALLAACEELGLEGIVCKRLDSIYRSGARTEEEVPGVARRAVAATDAGPVRPPPGLLIQRRRTIGRRLLSSAKGEHKKADPARGRESQGRPRGANPRWPAGHSASGARLDSAAGRRKASTWAGYISAVRAGEIHGGQRR